MEENKPNLSKYAAPSTAEIGGALWNLEIEERFVESVACAPLIKSHYSLLIVMVQRRSESDCTVIFSPLTMFEVLTKPPNLISVSSVTEKNSSESGSTHS